MDRPDNLTRIELAKLIPHPHNANVTPPDILAKLQRHIRRTGRYEPLIVRPHPGAAGCYQLINGHHRKEVLAALGHTHALCLVWSMSDAEALLLLATVNRLTGSDAAGKRLELLDALARQSAADAAALAELLPESHETLSRLLGEMPLPLAPEPPPALADMPEAFTIFLRAADKIRLTRALKATAGQHADAIMQWVADRERLAAS